MMLQSRVRPTTIVLRAASSVRMWGWRKTPSWFTISLTSGTTITNWFISLQSSIRNVSLLLLQKPSAYFWFHQKLVFLIAFSYGTIAWCACMTRPWQQSKAEEHHQAAEPKESNGRFWAHSSVLCVLDHWMCTLNHSEALYREK